MEASPEEVYYDTKTSVDDKSHQGENESDQCQGNGKNVYFELEKNAANQTSDEDEPMSREDKYKTAKLDSSGFKSETILKSNVNVANRAQLFEKERQKDDGHSPGQKLGAKSPTTNVYDKLWQGSSPGDKSEENVYALAGQISPQPVHPSQATHSPSAAKQESIYSMASNLPDFTHSLPKNKKQDGGKSIFYLSTPSLANSVNSINRSTNKGVQEGAGAAVPVDFVNPVKNTMESDDTEYNNLYFKSTAPGAMERPFNEDVRRKIREKGYDTCNMPPSNPKEKLDKSPPSLYDSDASEEDDDISFDWGSEFDELSYQDSIDDMYKDEDCIGKDKDSSLDKPLPPKPAKGKFGYQDLLPKPLRPTNQTDQHESVDLSSAAVCLPVIINPSKHPPPSLPSQPSGLTDQQKKCRCVIDLIISSERSYLESLERILKQYEKAILEAVPNPKARVRVVFAVIREIISHHKMFKIELAQAVSTWDHEEKIGDVFTASFSKTMVVNAYSIYVNNFSAAMEEIKAAQRNKQSFDEFLRSQEKSNADRLSIFGLMVKPVQRFPQFIMCLQDLIKYMSPTHHDRRALQLALTELENVTHMLNERKRCSEQKFQALQTIHQLIKQKPKHVLTGWNLDMNTGRRLIRYDSVDQVFGEFESMKCKDRRLILMNDLVLCVKIIEKEQSGYRVERLGLRWMAKLKDLELKDTAITPDMHSIIKKEPGKIHIISSQMDRQGKSEEDPFHLYADLSEMLHDYTVLGQIVGMVSTLKRSYTGHGLSEELVHEVSRDLQQMIQIKDEQLRLVNSCSLVLVDNSRSDKPHYVLQTKTPAIKQDWTVDFLMAKLAQDKNNSPAWDRTFTGEEVDSDSMPAHFMKHLPVDVPRNYTRTRCAVSVFLTPEKSPSGLGVQHLWVCSSSPTRGQVSILSIHNSKPALTESFRICNCEIFSVELIPGCGDDTHPGRYRFMEDTVWMSTENKELLMFPLSNSSGVRRDPLCSVRTKTAIISIQFVDERVFCGLDDGSMAVYSRQSDGAWNIDNPSIIKYGSSHVRIHFVWEEDLWLSCGNNLFIVEIDSLDTKLKQLLHGDHENFIDHVTKVGMGIWVSFTKSSFIKLFHVETLENLQEISVGKVLHRIASEKLWSLNPMTGEVHVSSLTASKGLLWIGTSLGVVLTLPLPRLSDGVPLYRGRPGVSLHAHQGPVKFLIPLLCSTNTMELKRSSTLRSTISSRPSRRNLEREKIELDESERKDHTEVGSQSHMATAGNQDKGQNSNSSHHSSELKVAPSNNINTGDKDVNIVKDENSNEEVYDDSSPSVESRSESEVPVKAYDDDPYMLRKRNSQDLSNVQGRKSRNLSFRSELAQRIMFQSRRLSGSCGDLMDSQPLEVEVLYENLLEEDDASMEIVAKPKSRAGNIVGSGMRHTLSNFRSSSIRKISSSYKSQFKKSPQPSCQSSSDISKQGNSDSAKSDAKLASSNSASSPSPILSPTSDVSEDSSSAISPKMSQLSSFRNRNRASTVRGTVRKSGGNNAVIVLSGGDGYRDLNESQNQSRSEDASIMLWIYKY